MSAIQANTGSFQPGSRAVIRTKTAYDANGRVVALSMIGAPRPPTPTTCWTARPP